MNYKSYSILCKPCTKCKITLIKPNEDYCSNCRYKPSSKKSVTAVKYKIFMTRFDSKNTKNIKCLLDKYSNPESGTFILIVVVIYLTNI
jgi:deoxyribodipyrimidine photolyase-like uncharacterized protein